MPPGCILIWSGAADNIPDGYVLCDGENGTPDLRNMFVIAAGGKYSVGQQGGAESVILSIDQMPRHYHNSAGLVSSSTGGIYVGSQPFENSIQCTQDASAAYTTSTGNFNSHSNMPPYYALCYIMKTEPITLKR